MAVTGSLTGTNSVATSAVDPTASPGLYAGDISAPRLGLDVSVEVDGVIAALERHGCTKDLDVVRKAHALATEVHQTQKRASGDPYIVHPVAVATIVAELGLDPLSAAAALLHDAVEDTEVTVDRVEREFGPQVAAMVDGVTKLDRVRFDSKEAQQAATMRKMIVAIAEDWRVLVIKLADRLHNMRTIGSMPVWKQQRTAKETLDIYAPLAHRLGIQEIKWQLEDLSFSVLHPKRYAEIAQLVALGAPARDEELNEILAIVRERLALLGLECEVTGRPKHLWSIYEKMVVKGKEFKEIYDLTGIRVVVDSNAECWVALGGIHSIWQPIPGRFKDYVNQPKFNLYQSLHTSAVGPRGKPVEVQIRTNEMHLRAEYGIAAHVDYKGERAARSGTKGADRSRRPRPPSDGRPSAQSGDTAGALRRALRLGRTSHAAPTAPASGAAEGPSGPSASAGGIDDAIEAHPATGQEAMAVTPSLARTRSPGEMGWLQGINDWQKDVKDPVEFLEYLKKDLEQDEVYVFTPKGKIIALAWGSCPVDMAYAIHTEVGHHCVGAKVNGRLVPLDSKLRSGDTIDILTSKAPTAGPSRDWLQIVSTARARNKIRQWFSRERRDDAIEAGREELAKALRRDGLPVQKLASSAALSSIVKELNYPDLDAMHVAIGEGHLSARSIVQRLRRDLTQGEADEQLPTTVLQPRRPSRRGSVGVYVEGLDDVMVRLSRCCTPVPGDVILGFVTRGRGVSVHRNDCANAISLAGSGEERLIEVEWDAERPGMFIAGIEVLALDRTRLLADVAKALSEHHVNILSSATHTAADRVSRMRFEFELADPAHLESLLSSLRRLDCVYDAYRILPGKGGAAAEK
jgi:GTP diphosphokinase / guanosine-3',5'-bis(diphosphate) 3'-diphosphatase